ncbi:MAG TPA: hypothetical protein VFK58_07135 [Sphingomicrobium sp.]|nr:hypothetical protein [Sphingomicrobium sp.]
MSKPLGSRGNFEDLRWLLDEVEKPLLVELGAPNERMKLLCEKLARCPAAHNRALLGEELN